MAIRLNVPSTFHGWVRDADWHRLFQESDLLAIPSLWPEPFGIVGIEAAAYGIPSVGYGVGGIVDWLAPGVTGELAPADPPTARGLAEALVRMLESPAYYRSLCEGARHMAKDYNAPQTRTTVVRRVKDRFQRGRGLRSERRNLTRARLLLCNSRRTQRDLVDRLAVPVFRTRVIYYGIDRERFALVGPDELHAARQTLGWPADRRHILFMGALGNRRKGFDTLFDAWAELCRDPAWDGHLVVAGAGAEQPVWQRRFAQAGLASHATFLGFREDVERLVAASDALVHPARYEAYGLGVHEALCRGVPALVSADAGVAERYPPELADLLIQDPESAGELAGRLRAWRARWDGVRRDLRSFADRLRARSWDDMAADIVAAVRSDA